MRQGQVPCLFGFAKYFQVFFHLDFFAGTDYYYSYICKGREEEEYLVSPDREDRSAAVRRSQGKRREGSFGAGILNIRLVD